MPHFHDLWSRTRFDADCLKSIQRSSPYHDVEKQSNSSLRYERSERYKGVLLITVLASYVSTLTQHHQPIDHYTQPVQSNLSLKHFLFNVFSSRVAMLRTIASAILAVFFGFLAVRGHERDTESDYMPRQRHRGRSRSHYEYR
ncbi:hypothetical protein K461DRAFT_52809 [Myriangium duriaei CBS 260.36]|uniref:Uncharacterized protein n=1 Tax=Myriangium duriaei CBS 260.36 TaxID=1168546 RepID=A0A9P4MGB5_9PEZI|nr:hypothetical protein K461DRAFT_52809 [Myriangium duriaei CBS 260.36]